jgi:hypothetical protein
LTPLQVTTAMPFDLEGPASIRSQHQQAGASPKPAPLLSEQQPKGLLPAVTGYYRYCPSGAAYELNMLALSMSSAGRWQHAHLNTHWVTESTSDTFFEMVHTSKKG